MAWRDREGWLNFMFLDEGRVDWEWERERWEEMGEIIMRNWDIWEFCVQVDWPSPKPQAWVMIRLIGIPIEGHLNQIHQVVLLISHIHSYLPYPPYHSHLHPPFLFLIHNSTIIAEHKVNSSLCISPCHDHELPPNTVNTKYSIHSRLSVIILMITSWFLNATSASGIPPYRLTAMTQPSITASKLLAPCHILMVASLLADV